MRKQQAKKIPLAPDPKFSDTLVTRFVNCMMMGGKKSIALTIFYDALDKVEKNLNIVSTAREYFGPINLQNMTVQLLDDYGRNLDLNNMDFSFCLTLTTGYDI